jgi:hypothetical protein
MFNFSTNDIYNNLYNRHLNPIHKTAFFANSVLHKQHSTSSRNGVQPPADASQFSILRAIDFCITNVKDQASDC